MSNESATSQQSKRTIRAILIGLTLMILSRSLDAPLRELLNLFATAALQTLVMLPSFALTAWQSLHSSPGDSQRFSICAVEILVFWPLVGTVAGLA
jgi:uncharacterized membrane protein